MALTAEFHDYCANIQRLASHLVSVCDGAIARDSSGFSKADVRLGRVMAYTPITEWSLELFVAGIGCLKTYSRTQLASEGDRIRSMADIAHEWQSTGAAVGKAGYIRPILGIEKNAKGEDTLCLHSLGWGDKAAEKALTLELRALKAQYDHQLGTYTFPNYTSLTTDYAATLRTLLDKVDQRPDATARITPLLAAPTATTLFARIDPSNPARLHIYLPRKKEIWKEFAGATAHSRVPSISTCYAVVKPHANDHARLVAFIDKHKLHLYPGVKQLIDQSLGPTKALPIPAHRLYMENGLIAVTVPTYNQAFTDWLKLIAPGCRFSKDEPGGPRWLIKPSHAAKLDALNVGLLTIGIPNYHIPPNVQAHIFAANEARKVAEKQKIALESINSAGAMEFPVRPGLGGTLLPHQPTCVAYAEAAMQHGKGIIIADDMGLGKTIESLAVIHHKEAFPAIITAPAGVLQHWANEAKTWLPGRRVHKIESGSTMHRAAGADVIIVSHSLLDECGPFLQRLKPASIVFDEGHYFQNANSVRGRAAESLAGSIPWRLVLTGTPVRNHNKNLVHQLRLIGRLDDLGGAYKFRERYCGAHVDDRGHWNFDTDTNTAELRELLLETCMIRREKHEVAKYLPPKLHTWLDVTLSNMSDYRRCERALMDYLLENNPSTANYKAPALQLITAMRVLVGRGKVNAALDFTENWEASTDQKLIVYAHHREVIDGWRATRPHTLFIDGSTSLANRVKAEKLFQEDPAHKIIVVSDAGRVGINLSAATGVLVTERSFVPSDIDQIIDRAHRIGQANTVNVYHMYAPGTIDDRIRAIEQPKRENIELLMGGRVSDSSHAAQTAESLLASYYADALKLSAQQEHPTAVAAEESTPATTLTIGV